MTQGDFAAKAFERSFESSRNKVKNIELGKQTAKEAGLVKMAAVLFISVARLKPVVLLPNVEIPSGAAVTDAAVLKCFPGLEVYLDMLNKAAKLEDAEHTDYIVIKITAIFAKESLSEVARDNSVTPTKRTRKMKPAVHG